MNGPALLGFRRSRTGTRRRAGFSLMEMMSAMTLLIIGAVAVFGLLMVSIQSNFEASHYSIARTLAEQKLENLRMGGTTAPTAGTSTVDESSSLPNGSMVTTITAQNTSGQTGLVLVNVCVSWREPGRGSVSINFSTLMCDSGITTS